MINKTVTTAFLLFFCEMAYAEQTMEENRTWCYRGQGLACTLAANKEVNRKRFKSARVLYEKGCKMGEEQSCIGLATLDIQDGRTQAARTHLEKSCKNRVSVACLKLSEIEMASGNKKRALEILTKDCHENISKEACAIIDRVKP